MPKLIYSLCLSLGLLLAMGIPASAQTLASAQQRSPSTNVTTEPNQVSLKSLLTQLESNFSIRFNYRAAVVRSAKVNARPLAYFNEGMTEQLNQLLAPLELVCVKIDTRTFVIREKRPIKGQQSPRVEAPQTGGSAEGSVVPPVDESKIPALDVVPDRIVTGKVTDDASGESLPGVNILLKGTQQGTTTNAEGTFSFTVPNNAAVLVFSFVGYISQEVIIGSKTSIDVSLKVDEKSLEEVVVVGYGTARKSDVTGAVASANMEAFRETPNVNVLQSLQGSVPGMNVGVATRAGDNPSFSIRGQNTISGLSTPLIVVDNIIFRGDLQDINSTDIESINILKDASSAAVYGSQAANGVVIITTKRGKEASKPLISYSGKYTVTSESNPLELYSAENYYKLPQAFDWRNSFLAPDYVIPNPDWDFKKLLQRDEVEALQKGLSTNWWDLSTRRGGIQAHDLSVSGRESKTSYYFSASYTNQKEVLINDDFKRFIGRINLETSVFDWLKIGANLMVTTSDRPGMEVNLQNAYRLSPLSVPYDDTGRLKTNPAGHIVGNPLIPLEIQYEEKRNHLNGNAFANIEFPFLKGLAYTVRYGNSTRTRDVNIFDHTFANFTGRAERNTGRDRDWTLDNIISYQKSFRDKHRLDLTLLYGRENRAGGSTDARGDVFENQTLGYYGFGLAQIYKVSAGGYEENSLYSMGRINYSLLNRYLATFTIRRDGFSGFGKENKFGVFPSFAAGWILSEEAFFKNLSLPVNFLKTRISYGVSGNRTVERYFTLAKVSITDAYVFGDGQSTEKGQRISALENSSLGWETTEGINLGLDFVLFSDRLSGNIDYYSTHTRDLLYTVALPIISGFSSIPANIGKIHNKGLEFSLKTVNVRSKDVSWKSTFNYSLNRNKVVSVLGLDENGDGKEDDLIASNIFIGQPLGSIYNYAVDGIYQLTDEIPAGFGPGYLRLRDMNGDGLIKPEDDRTILGYSDPAYRFSIFNEVTYKGWGLRLNINSIQGGKNHYLGLNSPYIPITDGVTFFQNRPLAWDFWTPSNPGAEYPSLNYRPGIMPSIYRQRSFVRLQDISLSYTFKTSLNQKLGLRNLKIFVSGKNLHTWTKWKGSDPESGGSLDYSRFVSKGFTIGLDVSL